MRCDNSSQVAKRWISQTIQFKSAAQQYYLLGNDLNKQTKESKVLALGKGDQEWGSQKIPQQLCWEQPPHPPTHPSFEIVLSPSQAVPSPGETCVLPSNSPLSLGLCRSTLYPVSSSSLCGPSMHLTWESSTYHTTATTQSWLNEQSKEWGGEQIQRTGGTQR